MPAILENLGLAYFPVPKIACTSIKTALWELEHGRPFVKRRVDGEMRRIHKEYRSHPFRRASLRQTAGLMRVAVIRDPVRRLLSAYGNRVLHHGQLRPFKLGEGVLEAAGLPPDPDIDTFFLNLDGYRALSRPIDFHTRPMAHFLGPDLTLYDHLFRFEALGEFEALLSRLTGREVAFPRLQTGGPRLTPDDLSPPARAALLAEAEADYAWLGDRYSPPAAGP